MITFLLVCSGLSFLSTRSRWKKKYGKSSPMPVCVKSSIAFIPVALITKRVDWFFLYCTSVWNHGGDCSKFIYISDKILAHIVPLSTLSSACWHPIGISGVSYSCLMFYFKTRKTNNLENNMYHASIHIIGSSCAILSWLRKKP